MRQIVTTLYEFEELPEDVRDVALANAESYLCEVTGLAPTENVIEEMKEQGMLFESNGTIWLMSEGSEDESNRDSQEWSFGTVTVSQATGSPPTIRFPAATELTVRDAEDFWSDLMNGIILAREIISDPV